MLNEQQIAVYSGLADVLIPSAEGMPSASEANVPTEWINVALGYRPDLVPHFERAVAACEGLDPQQALNELNQSDTEAFDALGVATSGAYFLNPDVKKLLGYPGQLPVPATDDTETYLDILENVVDRGIVYRPTTEVGS